MADYLDQTKAENAFGPRTLVQLTNDTGSGNTVNTTVLDQAIAAAEADVNACLNKGFTVPVTVARDGQPAYDTAVQICLRALRYHLFMRRPETMGPDSPILADYDAALKLALEMAKGRKALPGDPPVPRAGEHPYANHSTVSTLSGTSKPVTRNWNRNSQGNA
jgi:phage gp36-like protein